MQAGGLMTALTIRESVGEATESAQTEDRPMQDRGTLKFSVLYKKPQATFLPIIDVQVARNHDHDFFREAVNSLVRAADSITGRQDPSLSSAEFSPLKSQMSAELYAKMQAFHSLSFPLSQSQMSAELYAKIQFFHLFLQKSSLYNCRV
jgi:hypothetical protein